VGIDQFSEKKFPKEHVGAGFPARTSDRRKPLSYRELRLMQETKTALAADRTSVRLALNALFPTAVLQCNKRGRFLRQGMFRRWGI
jgi:hypothetical protein